METSAPWGPGMADASDDEEPEAGDSEPATYGNASPISATSFITLSGAVANGHGAREGGGAEPGRGQIPERPAARRQEGQAARAGPGGRYLHFAPKNLTHWGRLVELLP